MSRSLILTVPALSLMFCYMAVGWQEPPADNAKLAPKSELTQSSPPEVHPAEAERKWEPLYPSVAAECPAASAARQRIEQTLAADANFEYLDEQLRDVLEDIRFRYKLPVWVDQKALEDAGTALDAPVTISIQEVTVRSALRLMLDQLGLTYVIRDQVLRITTPSRAPTLFVLRLYPVGELLPSDENAEFLIQLIEDNVSSGCWQKAGGPGRISYLPHLRTLAILQSDDCLPEIEALLREMRRLR
jgi:hypothetical protein